MRRILRADKTAEGFKSEHPPAIVNFQIEEPYNLATEEEELQFDSQKSQKTGEIEERAATQAEQSVGGADLFSSKAENQLICKKLDKGFTYF